MIDPNALVAAGGIAQKGAKTDPKATAPLVGASFTHPLLEGRVVVRLADESSKAAIDAEMSVLGFATDGEPEIVGRTRRRALGFPAWAIVSHPSKARFALEVMRDFRQAAQRA